MLLEPPHLSERYENLVLEKRFRLMERINLQFRSEFSTSSIVNFSTRLAGLSATTTPLTRATLQFNPLRANHEYDGDPARFSWHAASSFNFIG